MGTETFSRAPIQADFTVRISRLRFRKGFSGALALVFLASMLSGRLSAQQQPPVFQHLGTGNDSFPDERFSCVYRGSHGFMWFGSARGLLRYGGSTHRWYRHAPDDARSISSGNVRVIFEDRDNRFWVGTNGGLSLLDRRLGRFTHHRHRPENPESLSHNNIWSIHQDRAGHLWVGTADGLNRMDGDRFVRYGEAEGLGSAAITAMTEDHDGRLWVATLRDGLKRYDAARDRFIHEQTLPARKISALHNDPHGRLWVGSFDTGAYVRAPGSTEWMSFRHDPALPSSLSGDEVVAIASGASRGTWIATLSGLNRYIPDQTGFQRYRHDPGDLDSLRDDAIEALYLDDDGLLWATTAGAGVDYMNLERDRFDFYAVEDSEIWSIYRRPEGPIWVGTKQGLARLDPETGSSRWFLDEHTVRAIRPAPDGDFYLGTDKTLFRFDPDHGNAQDMLTEETRIWRILPDREGGLMLGTESGLLHLAEGSNIPFAFPVDPRNPRATSHNVITSLVRDPSGGIWVGTFGGGLDYLDIERGTFHRYNRQTDPPLSLPADDVVDLYLDDSGGLWIGTLSGGLCHLDPDREQITRYNLETGFPDNAAVTLIGDRRGHLWVHTGVGLVDLDPETGNHILYGFQDGITLGGAIPGVAFRAPDSDVISMGGVYGLIRFRPEDLPKPEPPKLVFTSLEKSGREVAHLLLPGEQLHLERRHKSFGLRFAILDFLAPASQRFTYRREEIDEDWVASENRGQVSYTRYLGLGGEDRLLVRGTTGNGIWADAMLAVTFEPPIWITWLPLILISGLAVLVGIVYGLFTLREKRARARLEARARLAEEQRILAEDRARISERQRELARRERAVQEEHTRILQDHLDRVSTEIANDLHDGPLSVLHGLGFRLRALSNSEVRPEHQQALREIAEEALPQVCHHLRNTCGVLLRPDFREGLAFELDAFADVVESMYPSLTIARELGDVDDQLSPEQKAVLYRIYRTLLENVGKHACATDARVRLEHLDDNICLHIEDNGCGFEVPDDWESLKQDKHYGMVMVDYFTRSLGGRFSVVSSPGRGTAITVTLPPG